MDLFSSHCCCSG